LDEPDSGLDVDGRKVLMKKLADLDWPVGLAVVTHQTATLEALKPDVVYVIKGGRLAATGGAELISQIQANGFKDL
jgi:Fe-S cluster assembly ATP-binding protein